ncbi:MAG: N-formylglutamate amidohydrolase [Solirubrobacterales bacterium]|nr:N-formylglutamate amidohydrolase [Solirubrobacterales bacterium]
MERKRNDGEPGGSAGQTNWTIRPGHRQSGVILHVPHASREIPVRALERILLGPEELERELDAMTDADTDLLAREVAERSLTRRPWIFENRFSRLLVDPERFPDEREEMSRVGMGRVYLKTSDGRELRKPDPSDDDRLIGSYFDPYARAFEQLVAERLEEVGEVLIIDLHSFPVERLPYELRPEQARPSLCLGTDDFHTPEGLASYARSVWPWPDSFELDQPFPGSYVPLGSYRSDRRVSSVMFEIRRDVVANWARGERCERPVPALPSIIASMAICFTAGLLGTER